MMPQNLGEDAKFFDLGKQHYSDHPKTKLVWISSLGKVS
jgi:hypothetical protein